MLYCSVFTQSGTLMNKLAMTGAVPVTGCLTLLCRGERSAGGRRRTALARPRRRLVAQQPSQLLQTHFPSGLGPLRPSGNSPNLQDLLCALEKRREIT